MSRLPGRASGFMKELNEGVAASFGEIVMTSQKKAALFEITRIRDFEATATISESCLLTMGYGDETQIFSVRTVSRAKGSRQWFSSAPREPLKWLALAPAILPKTTCWRFVLRKSVSATCGCSFSLRGGWSLMNLGGPVRETLVIGHRGRGPSKEK